MDAALARRGDLVVVGVRMMVRMVIMVMVLLLVRGVEEEEELKEKRGVSWFSGLVSRERRESERDKDFMAKNTIVFCS